MSESVRPSPEQYREALNALGRGGIVAYPTETFYGLAVDPGNEEAVSALYKLKKREHRKPLSLLVADMAVLSSCIRSFPAQYRPLIDAFWPGPLTLVFPAQFSTSPMLRGGGDTLAIRISSHPVARQLCSLWGGALTATSANASGQPPFTSGSKIKRHWPDKIDYILDGGSVAGGKGSTMLEVINGEIHIIRQGVITTEQIRQALKNTGEKLSF